MHGDRKPTGRIPKYNITIDGQTDGEAGTHGPILCSRYTGNPKSRVQWSNTFGTKRWSITGTLNFVSSFGVTDPASEAMDQGPQAACLDALTNGGGAAFKGYAGPWAGMGRCHRRDCYGTCLGLQRQATLLHCRPRRG